MLGGHGSRCFGGEVVDLGGFDIVIDAVNDLFGHFDRIYIIGIQAINQLFDAGSDLVKLHCLPFSVSFRYKHGGRGLIRGTKTNMGVIGNT